MPRIVSIHSFRGGTGKSNLSANVAAVLARAGRRVAVVDTDIQSPGVHVLFGLAPNQIGTSLNDYLWGRCAAEEAAHDVGPAAGVDPSGPGALFLMPSSLNGREISRVLRDGYDVNRLDDGFRAVIAALKLDYLIIDTHPGVNEETLLSIGLSDFLFIVLRPDAQDLQGTAVTVELARRLSTKAVRLVLNKVPPGIDAAAAAQQVSSLFQVPVAAVLPLATEMVVLGSRGLMAIQNPASPFAQGVQRLVALMEGGLAGGFGGPGGGDGDAPPPLRRVPS